MGVFDYLPGIGGGDVDDGAVQSPSSTDDTRTTTEDRRSNLTPADFRERAETLAGRSDVPTLDFTTESLRSLDELAEGYPDSVDELAYGSYLGETIIRTCGGEWKFDDAWQVAVSLPDDETTIAVFDAAAMSIADSPVFGRVAERLEADGASRSAMVDESNSPDTTDTVEATGQDIAGENDSIEGSVQSTADSDQRGPEPADTASESTEPYVLRRAAESFADTWPDQNLDFTPESLTRLDTFVDSQWEGRFKSSQLEDRTVDHGNSADPLIQAGSYYGEVLVRWLDGEWVTTDDGESDVAVPDIGERTVTQAVFSAARECLGGCSTFAYRFDALSNRLHRESPTVSDGRSIVFDADDGTLTSGDVITQFVDAADDLIERWPGYSLDYSPRSIGRLDDLVDDELADTTFEGIGLADGTDPESLRLTARSTALGAYFSVVMVRHLDAQWEVNDDVVLVIDSSEGETRVEPVETAAACLRGSTSFASTYTAVRD